MSGMTLNEVSEKLGGYMLKGWVLTDVTCSRPGCSVPLMRSPKGHSPVVQFCVSCDGDPASQTATSSVSSGTHHSRSSTPPTEMSSALSSPTFAPPPETEASIRRRQQSDLAASEIGKRLLRGWAMLADECPNPGCPGVPLVRPPNVSGDKDPKKECVLCGSVYVAEVDSSGLSKLVPFNNTNSLQDASSTNINIHNPPSRRDPKTEGLTSQVSEPMDVPTPSRMSSVGSNAIPEHIKPARLANPPMNFQAPRAKASFSVDASAKALELTLHTLSNKLTSLSQGDFQIDPGSIGLTADAITKAAQALSVIRQLQWSERQAAPTWY